MDAPFIDFDQVNSRVAAFNKRHGASVAYGEWILFEDGARREQNPLGALIEPPDIPWDRAKRIAQYHAIILDAAVKAFDRKRRYYMECAQGSLNQPFCPPAAVDAAVAGAELRTLQAKVKEAKAAHDKATAAVEAAKPAYFREREQDNAANRAANQALMEQLSKITV